MYEFKLNNEKLSKQNIFFTKKFLTFNKNPDL